MLLTRSGARGVNSYSRNPLLLEHLSYVRLDRSWPNLVAWVFSIGKVLAKRVHEVVLMDFGIDQHATLLVALFRARSSLDIATIWAQYFTVTRLYKSIRLASFPHSRHGLRIINLWTWGHDERAKIFPGLERLWSFYAVHAKALQLPCLCLLFLEAGHGSHFVQRSITKQVLQTCDIFSSFVLIGRL